MESLTEITLRIYLQRSKMWPDADPAEQVKESARIAHLIIKEAGEVTFRVLYQNLKMDYDSLQKKYQGALGELGGRFMTKMSERKMKDK